MILIYETNPIGNQVDTRTNTFSLRSFWKRNYPIRFMRNVLESLLKFEICVCEILKFSSKKMKNFKNPKIHVFKHFQRKIGFSKILHIFNFFDEIFKISDIHISNFKSDSNTFLINRFWCNYHQNDRNEKVFRPMSTSFLLESISFGRDNNVQLGGENTRF